jgi:Tol biopolymer transport system component
LDFSDDMSRVVLELEMKSGGVAGCLVIDRARDEAHLLAAPGAGASMDASLSGDGRYVAFVTTLSSSDPFHKPRGLWVHDLRSQSYELVPLERWADADAVDMLTLFDSPQISRSGRYIALLGSLRGERQMPRAALLVDRRSERVSVISRDEEGVPVDAPCYGAKPSDGGDCVLFISNADLTGYDWNKNFDIFRYDCAARRAEQVSMDALHRTGDKWSFDSDMSEDGRSIVFWSQASNLVPDDHNDRPDIYLWRR